MSRPQDKWLWILLCFSGVAVGCIASCSSESPRGNSAGVAGGFHAAAGAAGVAVGGAASTGVSGLPQGGSGANGLGASGASGSATSGASGATGPSGGAASAGSNGSAGSSGSNSGAAGSSGSAGSGAITGVTVVTNRYDNLRSGANLAEMVLTPASVKNHFGLLFSRPVDGQIYAQPLYFPGLTTSDGKTHNVVFVATAHNSVYAFDADQAAVSAPLWQVSLGPSGQTSSFSCTDMMPEVGITSTPVIDPQASNLYVVSKGQENGQWVQRINVLDIHTGKQRAGSPLAIAASIPGNGDGSAGGKIAFNAKTQLNRPGLLLQGGTVYLAFASHCDEAPYHGIVLGYSYDGVRLSQTRTFTVSPNGSAGGIWQAGVGLSTDGDSIYFAAGNGSTNPNASPPDLSESVVRLGLSDFAVKDYWTPTSYAPLNGNDSDLSSGATLLPHNLLITGSKDGRLYLLDRANLGKFHAVGDAILQVVTTPGKADGERGHVHGGPIYYKNPAGTEEWVLMWPESSPLMRFVLNPTTRQLEGLVIAPLASPGHPGGLLSLSANGASGGGVLWASMASGSDPDGAWHGVAPGTLYAVDPASNPPTLLWSSDQSSARDALGNVAKFNTPVVANGRVYAATFSNALRVYGLLN